MAHLKWKLREYLHRHEIATLALEASAQVSRVTLYRLTSPNPKKHPQRMDFQTLTAVIGGLRTLTGHEVSVCDLLEYEENYG